MKSSKIRHLPKELPCIRKARIGEPWPGPSRVIKTVGDDTYKQLK